LGIASCDALLSMQSDASQGVNASVSVRYPEH